MDELIQLNGEAPSWRTSCRLDEGFSCSLADASASNPTRELAQAELREIDPFGHTVTRSCSHAHRVRCN